MTRTDLVQQLFMACCVLHNICLLNDDLIDIPVVVNADNNTANPQRELNEPPELRQEGLRKRVYITNTLNVVMNG